MSVITSKRTRIPLARHIIRRLQQHGCNTIHGVPGDYSLPFLSYLKPARMNWVGSTNELNAAYAADGYARVKGLGALCTTYGVGELSAINAIAGSYAERVPIVHIVGTPNRALQTSWLADQGVGRLDGLVHHSLGRGTHMRVYGRIAKQVVARSVYLDQDLETGAAEFDDALKTCLTEKKPIYVQMPSDAAGYEIEAFNDGVNLFQQIEEERRRKQDDSVAEAFIKILKKAKQPLIMVDGLAARFGLNAAINEFARATEVPIVVTCHGLGIVDPSLPNYYGIYDAKGGNPRLHKYVQESDYVFIFGELFSDTNSMGWTAIPPSTAKHVLVTDASVTIDTTTYKQHVPDLLYEVASKVPDEIPTHERHISPDQSMILPEAIRPGDATAALEPLKQDTIYNRLSAWFGFQSDATLILANGTPKVGAPLLSLSPSTTVVVSGLWFSVGHMLPAAQGVALAKRELLNPPEVDASISEDVNTNQGSHTPSATPSAPNKDIPPARPVHDPSAFPLPHLPFPPSSNRTVLLEGDGSFQATATELSTIIRQRLPMTIFLFNNKGYAYERLIMGPEEDYNAIQDWDYTLAPSLFAGEDEVAKLKADGYPIYTRKVSTVGELEAVFTDPDFNTSAGLKLIELKLGETDVPAYYRVPLSQVRKKLVQRPMSQIEEEAAAAAAMAKKIRRIPSLAGLVPTGSDRDPNSSTVPGTVRTYSTSSAISFTSLSPRSMKDPSEPLAPELLQDDVSTAAWAPARATSSEPSSLLFTVDEANKSQEPAGPRIVKHGHTVIRRIYGLPPPSWLAEQEEIKEFRRKVRRIPRGSSTAEASKGVEHLPAAEGDPKSREPESSPSSATATAAAAAAAASTAADVGQDMTPTIKSSRRTRRGKSNAKRTLKIRKHNSDYLPVTKDSPAERKNTWTITKHKFDYIPATKYAVGNKVELELKKKWKDGTDVLESELRRMEWLGRGRDG